MNADQTAIAVLFASTCTSGPNASTPIGEARPAPLHVPAAKLGLVVRSANCTMVVVPLNADHTAVTRPCGLIATLGSLVYCRVDRVVPVAGKLPPPGRSFVSTWQLKSVKLYWAHATTAFPFGSIATSGVLQ